jgi:hypothetical protein
LQIVEICKEANACIQQLSERIEILEKIKNAQEQQILEYGQLFTKIQDFIKKA